MPHLSYWLWLKHINLILNILNSSPLAGSLRPWPEFFLGCILWSHRYRWKWQVNLRVELDNSDLIIYGCVLLDFNIWISISEFEFMQVASLLLKSRCTRTCFWRTVRTRRQQKGKRFCKTLILIDRKFYGNLPARNSSSDDLLEILQPSHGSLQRAWPRQKWPSVQGKIF